jgi:hypothetical protein
MGTFGELTPELASAVALGEVSNKPKVMGMGIYLELPNANGDQATQILITPEGKNEKGQDVAMAISTRTISDWSPRKQWRISFIRPDKELTTAEAKASAMSEQVERVLKRQMKYGLTNLRGAKPIVFELTDMDFTEIGDWKAPASALRRIQKTRLALGFPEKPYNSKA